MPFLEISRAVAQILVLLLCTNCLLLEVFNLGSMFFRHGYGRWQAIIDDKELRIQEVVCKELNLPSISLPVPGTSQPQVPPAPGASQALPASGVSQAQVSAPGVYQAPNGVNTANAGTVGNQVKDADGSTHEVSHGTSDPSNRTQLHQDSSLLYHFREMQRRQVEFIRKRVMLLENAINAEYQREVVVSHL